MLQINPSAIQASPITDVAILTPAECVQVRSAVENLREHWIQRHPVFPFYTLGASNYFDLAYLANPPYYEMAAACNHLLQSHLGWLYQKVAETLAQHLQAPVAYRDSLALPGFHIFLSDRAFERPKALTHQEWFQARYDPETMSNPVHCDTPHLLFNWGASYQGVDFQNPISITLSIALPSSGAGMYVWDLHRNETLGMSQDELLQQFEARERRLHPYAIGHCALHSGFYYHQVAPFWNAQPDDIRITLQGHGLRCQGVWQLYW